KYKVLVKLADILPNAEGSPVRPFLSFVIFRSGETTHFNLDYLGRRVSLVMHTDAEEKILKDLAEKKKKVAEDAAETKKKDNNMVSMILDDEASSEIEVNSDQVGEGRDESHQDQEVNKEDNVDELDEGTLQTVVGLKEEDQEFNKHFNITSSPRNKVKLSNLNSLCTKHIAICAHKTMRLHGATVNSFPSAFDREELCWDLLVSSTKDNEVLWEKMSLIQSDDDLKAYLIDYTWKAAGHLRGEFVAKAHISVPSTYRIGELKHEELERALKWLEEEASFIHRRIDVKVSVLSIERL
ncbi:hypothetical protein BDR03DRAFT_869144, partial [Suillus americanus]